MSEIARMEPGPTPLSVAAIGTCRVQVPLGILAEQGPIAFVPDEAIGYLHNPLEMLQALRQWRGEIVAPPALRPLLAITRPDLLEAPDRYSTTFGQSRLIVVEVSSVRTIRYEGWQLQINGVRQLLNPLGVGEREIGRLFRDPSSRESIHAAIRDGDRADLARDIVARADFARLGGVALLDAVRALRSALDRPVLLVGFMSSTYDGKPIAERVDINAALAEVARTMPDTDYLDPTPLVERHGAARVLKDLGHYTPGFEKRIAVALLKRIRSLAARLPH